LNSTQKWFLGIDASLTNTGITLLISPTQYTSFSIKAKGGTQLERMELIAEQLLSFIVEQNIDPMEGTACIEGGSYHSNGMIYQMGQLTGMIIHALHQFYVNPMEIPPSQVKKFISGVGSASKQCVMDSIKARYREAFTDDNQADSYALALIAYRYYHYPDSPFRSELEVIKKLRSPNA
jgi:Holliday junction resolvasome RuvABC endonuclease subunit